MEDQEFHQKSSYKVIHFYLTQIPVLILLEVSSAILYFKYSEKFILSFSFIPVVGFYLYFLYKFGWSGDWRQVSRRFFFSMIGFFIFAPIFFSIYFLVWNPTLSLNWFKSQQCTVQGQFVTQLGNLERYGVQYVQIGSDMIGMACISNHKTSTNLMKGYDFYQQGDFYTCDNSFNQTGRFHIHDKNIDQQNRILQYDSSYQQQQNEQSKNNKRDNTTYADSPLVNEQNKQQNQNQTQKKSSFAKRCRMEYRFTKVKIPSWLCQSAKDNQDMIVEDADFINTQSACYYAYYGQREQARQNSRTQNTNLKEQSDFILVRLDKEVYFFREGFICLIVFAMYPAFLFSLQAPFSEIVYRLMVFFYKQTIKEENEALKSVAVQEPPIFSSKQVQEEAVGSTSQTDRQKQKIQPHQIIQILSPNSQQKDRDFYNIYQGTRRKQPITSNNSTTTNNTEEPINISKFNGDTTKSVMIKKHKQKAYAQSIDDIDDLNGQNGPRNGFKDKAMEQNSSSEEEDNGQDSSYIKIRNIYKKKLNPKYQKETKEKLQKGIKIENEEVKVIQEIKQKQQEYSKKQKKPRQRNQNNTQNQTYGEESPIIDENKFKNDFIQIMDANSEQQNNQIKIDEKQKVKKEQIPKQTKENTKIKKQSKDLDQIQNDLQQIQKDEKEQDEMVKKLQEAYDIYSDQVNNKNGKEIDTPPQEQQLIQ